MFPNRPDTGDDRPAYAFLVSTTGCVENLAGTLGRADYSYAIVMRALSPALERLGTVELVARPESSLPYKAEAARSRGLRPVHLAIHPVHNAYLTPRLPNVLFPFWEFPTIPDRDFGFDTRQNWARIAGRADLIVTACRFTADAFRRAGLDVPIGVVPVPLAASAFEVGDYDRRASWTTRCRHMEWGGRSFRVAFAEEPPDPLVDPEAPPRERMLHAGLRRARASYRRHLRPWIGDAARHRIARAKNALIRRAELPPERLPVRELTLSGLVYTSIFNFSDRRKNTRDLLSGFLAAFRDRPDATLVLKLATDPEREPLEVRLLGELYDELAMPHACRVVIVTDYLGADQMRGLMGATTYYVNTSRAEGACLPIQEALAAGRPVLAPCHTAMAEYLDDTVAFPIGGRPEATYWPHDPDHRHETTWHRLDWAGLVDRYRESAAVADRDPGRYAAMSRAARARAASYAGLDVATAALQRALDLLPESAWDRRESWVA